MGPQHQTHSKMKLIILSGPKNCGKTKSLNVLHDLLMNLGRMTEKSRVQVGNPIQNDFEYLLEGPNSIQIAISTWGDYPDLLNDFCRRYCNCDAVICACNMNFMRNRVHMPFEDAMNFDCLTTIILKTPELTIKTQNIANEKCAQYLLNILTLSVNI